MLEKHVAISIYCDVLFSEFLPCKFQGFREYINIKFYHHRPKLGTAVSALCTSYFLGIVSK